MQKTILAFSLTEDQKQVLKTYTDNHQILLKNIPARELGMTIGCLAGMTPPGAKGQTGGMLLAGSLPGPMLVFCAVPSEQLDQLEEFCSIEQTPLPELKAVLTPFNMNWTPRQLYAAIAEEHARLHGQ